MIDGNFNSEVALDAVATFIQQKVDGIMYHTLEPEVLDAGIKMAQEAGIPIITFYVPPKTKISPHVQIDEAKTSFELGVIAAGKWQEFYPGKPIYIGVIDIS